MDNNTTTISYAAHEGMMARMERTIRRLWVLCIILILLLASTNAAWIYYEKVFRGRPYRSNRDLTNSKRGFTAPAYITKWR